MSQEPESQNLTSYEDLPLYPDQDPEALIALASRRQSRAVPVQAD